ncbi:hypothetical protein PROVRETT_05384 [Providencia rettgeri DSM 1131]|nr:hypothetical protein PROVRETT_05384 [Providencia rettgeri DSM 1131]
MLRQSRKLYSIWLCVPVVSGQKAKSILFVFHSSSPCFLLFIQQYI